MTEENKKEEYMPSGKSYGSKKDLETPINEEIKNEEKNEKFYCYDCGKKDVETEIIIENEEIKNGVMLEYELPNKERRIIFKCNDCYEKDKSYKNYQKNEVYSRIVGYLRPLTQWNKGKVQEFSDRKNYKVK